MSACAANPSPSAGNPPAATIGGTCKTKADCTVPSSGAGQGSSSTTVRRSQQTQPSFISGSAPSSASYSDQGGVGDMELSYLRPSPATKLYVEIAHVKGETPAQGALDHLEQILRRETQKTVTVALGAQIPSTQTTYSFDDIQRLSARYRAHHSVGDTVTAWLVYLNGQLQNGQGVLGVAYRASEIAVFPDQINQASTALVDNVAIERSVLVHEFGHLLGLVNIGYHSHYDHEDPQHPKHSKYQTSVMYWAIDDISITSLLNGGPPDDYDQYDKADLAMLRAS